MDDGRAPSIVLGRCWYFVIRRFSRTAVSRLFFAFCRLTTQNMTAHNMTAAMIQGTIIVVFDTPPLLVELLESCLGIQGLRTIGNAEMVRALTIRYKEV
jgi:hypothetical protein